MRPSFHWVLRLGLPLTVATAVLAADIDTVAKVTVASGPHAGTHTLESNGGCAIRPPRDGGPDSFDVMLSVSEDMKMSRRADNNYLEMIQVDVPNVDSKHLGELALHVVFGNPKKRLREGIAYSVDTRPDSSLDDFERQVRGKRPLSGRGGAKLRNKGATAMLEFWGETKEGVRIDGTIDCREVDRE